MSPAKWHPFCLEGRWVKRSSVLQGIAHKAEVGILKGSEIHITKGRYAMSPWPTYGPYVWEL